MHTFGLHPDGPYGGMGGSAYDARNEEQKLRHLDAWATDYNGYRVLGAIRFEFDQGSSGRIGGKDPNLNYYPESYDFDPDETIKEMWVYAGDNEGYVNGFKFKTDRGEFEIGGTEGKETYLHGRDLGANGEWAGATGRDTVHGADAVVDNMILYFRD
ncbi:hypothetical protein AbraIFM66950_008184 [Aspergillus brasiliensis]|nr:hypothetical protein AbraIFM66950_008184 [Aspergillus brasiliensis]